MDEPISSDEGARSASFDRRLFIKRVAIGTVVAAPIVSSFSMAGVNAAFAAQTNVSGQPPSSVSPATVSATTTTTTAPATTTTSTTQAPTTTTSTTVGNQPLG